VALLAIRLRQRPIEELGHRFHEWEFPEELLARESFNPAYFVKGAQEGRGDQQPEDAYVASWNTAIDALSANDYPHLHLLRTELTSVASRDQFEYGLALLVESLRTRAGETTSRRAATKRSRSSP